MHLNYTVADIRDPLVIPNLRLWPRRRRRWPAVTHRRREITGQRSSSPWSAWRSGMTCGVALSVTVGFKMEFFYFQKWMNSIYFCYFWVDLFRAPKILKIFVWLLCDVYYLGKIWNVDFQYFLNMIKIAQLINKWVSRIFLGLFMYPKIMKIVLPLSYHVMSLHKKN